jgi:hypothetical protein
MKENISGSYLGKYPTFLILYHFSEYTQIRTKWSKLRCPPSSSRCSSPNPSTPEALPFAGASKPPLAVTKLICQWMRHTIRSINTDDNANTEHQNHLAIMERKHLGTQQMKLN